MPMPTYENIAGQKLLTLFHQLTADKTLVNVSVQNNDFESLTLVTRTLNDGAGALFYIDPPKGLVNAVAKSKTSRLHFEFNSVDRVTHRFEANIKTISPDAVCLVLPTFVQRHQQRDNFRVKAQYDSYAKLSIDEIELRMAIDNVSLGGVYCLCPKKYKSKFHQEQMIKNMELFMTLEKECFVVPIQQVRVNRFETKPLPKHFGIAFEFIRIKRSPKKLLVQQIYELQRHFLQNRLKFIG
jgi:hypothetical protein